MKQRKLIHAYEDLGLCEDVLYVIILFCPIKSILKMERVCKIFHKIINSTYFLDKRMSIKLKSAGIEEKKKMLFVNENDKINVYKKGWGCYEVPSCELSINRRGCMWEMVYKEESFETKYFKRFSYREDLVEYDGEGGCEGLIKRTTRITDKSLCNIICYLF